FLSARRKVVWMEAKTRNDLARQLGVSAGTVTRYLARPDFPVKRKPPWSSADVGRIRHWRITLQEDRAIDDGASDDMTRKVNTGLKLERMKLTMAQRKRIERQYVDRRILDAAM